MLRVANELHLFLMSCVNISQIELILRTHVTDAIHVTDTSHLTDTARSVEDETRNAELNGNRNPEWWGDFNQLQIQSRRPLNLNLYREIPRNSNPIKISIRLCTVRYREI